MEPSENEAVDTPISVEGDATLAPSLESDSYKWLFGLPSTVPMDWLTDTPIAHRGLHGDGRPENSLAAIEAAVESGYPVEIDVRLTADGVPVAFHDPTLGRLTGREGRVDETEWADLGDVTLAGSGEQVPRLSEVLALVDGSVGLLVELKNASRAGLLEATVADRLDAYDGPLAVQSFNPLTVAWFGRNRPEWPRGQLSCFFETVDMSLTALERVLLKRLLVDWYSRPNFVAYDHERLPYGPVTRARGRGRPVLAWTVRSREAVARVAPHADNVIFEGFRP